MKKRIFALLLCCICIFSLFALPLSAATNENVTNLLSYRLLLKILGPHAQITSPSNGVIRCYFPFYSPGYTFSVSFSVIDLCNYAGVTFEPNVFSFLNLPGSLTYGYDIALTEPYMIPDSSTPFVWRFTLDSNSCVIFNFPVICIGSVSAGDVDDAASWPPLVGNNLIPSGFVEPGRSYEDGYNAGKTDGYDEGYDVGFQAGVDSVPVDDEYREGYEAGYAAGSKDAIDSFGAMAPEFLSKATYTLHYSYTGTIEMETTFTPSFVEGGVVFPNFADIFFDSRPDELLEHDMVDYYYVVISLPDSAAFNYDSNGIFINGAYPLLYSTFTSVDGRVYAGSSNLSSAGDRLMIAGTYPRNMYVNKITLDMNGVSYSEGLNLSFSLYSSNTVYSNGYAAGYSDAMNDNADEFTKAAWKEGYQTGYDTGFADGNVVSQQGNFNSLIYAVVEAPFNTFRSLFNFEILGVNLLAFIGSLLTLCVLLFIVKKVI